MRPPVPLPLRIEEEVLVLTKRCVPLNHSSPPAPGLSLPIRKMRVGTTYHPESCLLRQPVAAFHGLAPSHLPSGFLASTQSDRSLHLCRHSSDSRLQTDPSGQPPSPRSKIQSVDILL